ncbi:MAG: hypothetical protein K5695_14960 [Oscillospiraceae bacterium]|nr:hypothetical protein [Oscillospiraceae bacterium]
MAKNVIQYDLLISCPGDVKEEIECIKSAVEQFNSTFADSLGISIRIKHWSKNSYPQSGGKPQALLNEQFVNDCDAAVAIMWTRFGTPTDEYGSGTEEEIEIMLHDGKQVFMYFCDKPLNPSQMDSEEYKRVKAFKDKYKDRGIYSTYTSIDDFKRDFFAHLSQYFLSLKTVGSMNNERHSSLFIKGLDRDNHISDVAVIREFKLTNAYDKNGYIAKIREYYSEIDSIKTAKVTGNSILSDHFSFMPPVAISDSVKTYITEIAQHLNIELNENFFDLGNLHESLDALPIYSSVSGSEQEKRKYHLIFELRDTIQDFLKWISADKALTGMKSIGLVLANAGTDYDEDVEVSLSFPKDSLVTVDTFPKLSVDDKNYLMNDRDLDEIFHISATAEFLDYANSVNSPRQMSIPVNPTQGIFGSTYDNSDGFIDRLSDAWGFEVYSTDKYYVVKIKFDYIKHNTSVAFPSIILLFNDITDIPYTITSKRNAAIINGTITVIL